MYLKFYPDPFKQRIKLFSALIDAFMIQDLALFREQSLKLLKQKPRDRHSLTEVD